MKRGTPPAPQTRAGRPAVSRSRRKEILVREEILGTNRKVAAELRKRFEERGVLAVNMISSPGAGKTALLEALADRVKGRFRMAVIEGDIETERDAERIRRKGVPARQITTGGACHLEAKMIGKVIPSIPGDVELLFIENVGNLVCPASFDLGESLRLVLLSSPEGDDKPKKYPEAFLSADVLIISKADLFPHLPFDAARAAREALDVNPRLLVFVISALTGQGLPEFVEFLAARLAALRHA
ncbi:MAG: hydrogenase nickel incorporation protein HypB [Candidatus Aminicenantes bacterium]|nr:hydrogenase nickel incorporation protein HypB [Candidatus Aminicenantes bacterium]